jgi:hypothetical protein
MNELLKIQEELKAPKSQFNGFGKYYYRNLEDIFEAVKPLLIKYEVLLNVTDEIVMIGERYYIKATATATKGDKSISTIAYARESENKKGMDDSQITGATSSYARKYALNALFLLDDTKESDSMNNKKDDKTKSVVSNLTKLKAELKKRGSTNTDEALKLLSELTGNGYTSLELSEQSAQEALADIYRNN